jgi:antitoxin Phd
MRGLCGCRARAIIGSGCPPGGLVRDRCLAAGTAGPYTESMSEPVQDVPVSSPAIERAVDLARRGVITHLTIHGERVAAIVPESVIEVLRSAEDAEDAAEADAAMDEPGESVPWEQVKAELGL